MLVMINDFVEDLNYRRIVLDVSNVDKNQLKDRLIEDKLNKVYRLDQAKYMYVENCDFNGEEIEDIEDFLQDGHKLYTLLYHDMVGYFYKLE